MSTFAQIEQNIMDNMNDQGIYFDASEMSKTIQDAYNLIVAASQCLVKKVNLPFQSNLIYYNFLDDVNFSAIYVSDFLSCTAIFSYLTNLWLLDDKTLRDFDKDRVDFENWTGGPVWWAPCNDMKRIAIIPYQPAAASNFDMYYWATAPSVVSSATPLIPNDFQYLIELYVTAKFSEIAQEFSKAKNYWNEFWGKDDRGDFMEGKGLSGLAERSKNIAKSDLLMLG